ncbi:MAG: hypothetical protein K6G28_01665 [Acholeplasmatales bacterium]|nr:hypothetical protein [Acholeplasmatales bacterium]
MIYVVGDSTVSSFVETYYYQRYGWGTQLARFMKDVKIINLAYSGRSSLSFLKEKNYNEFKDNIKRGDFLFIGFGHNDEKDDDKNRYTNPKGSISEVGSFKNVLYENYIRICEKVGATPILVTPVARLSETNEYTGTCIHITKNGDYRQALIELGNEVGIACVDLTTWSANLDKSLGYNKAALTHAITKGKELNGEIVPDILTVDNTHLNIYGARLCAYYICKTLKELKHPISSLLINEINMPNEENDLIRDKDYVYVPYVEPDFSLYKAQEWYKTEDKNYVGVAFGDTGRGAIDTANGYMAYQKNDKFIVGQKLGEDTIVPLGKIALNSEGAAFVGRKVSVTRNFTFEADAKVLFTTSDNTSGFGISLRDDFYLDLNIPDKTITSNYVASGLLNGVDNLYINFDRKNHVLEKNDNTLLYKFVTGDTAHFKIYRLGQVVEVTTIFKGKTFVNTYTDFDFTTIDKFNMYLTMFAARSTVVEFSNVKFNDLGQAINA